MEMEYQTVETVAKNILYEFQRRNVPIPKILKMEIVS